MANDNTQDIPQVVMELPTPVRRSDTMDALAAALAKAQGQIEGAAKGKENPHFRSKYADLASVWDACREALSANAIAVVQSPSADGARVTVTTLLAHSSGQWIESDLTMAAADAKPQTIGSAITYGRRYGLASMVGVAPEDDDGNAAQGRSTPDTRAMPSTPDGFENWLLDLEATADEGTAVLQKAWKGSQPYLRKFLTDTNAAKWDAIKTKAAKVDRQTEAA